MTLEQLIKQFDEAHIPHNWDIKLQLPNEYFDLKGIHIIDQNEVGLVFEDHQRLTSLNEDPEQYEIPVASGAIAPISTVNGTPIFDKQ